MEINLRSEYGMRFNTNVKVFALLAAILFGIFLVAFNSDNVYVKHAGDTEASVEYVID